MLIVPVLMGGGNGTLGEEGLWITGRLTAEIVLTGVSEGGGFAGEFPHTDLSKKLNPNSNGRFIKDKLFQ